MRILDAEWHGDTMRAVSVLYRDTSDRQPWLYMAVVDLVSRSAVCWCLGMADVWTLNAARAVRRRMGATSWESYNAELLEAAESCAAVCHA